MHVHGHNEPSRGRTASSLPNHDGMLDACQYREDQTNMTRVGFFRTAELYLSSQKWPTFSRNGKGKYSGMRMDGLSKTNKHTRKRAVVMHEADYNQHRIMGRSFGCPAFRPSEGRAIMNRIREGSLFYAYAPQCSDLYATVLEQVPRWQGTCL